MIEVSWEVYDVKREMDTGLITHLFWTCLAQDGEESFQSKGATVIDRDDLEEFVPFENVTEEMVMGWLTKSNVDIEHVESRTLNLFNKNFNASSMSGLPWRGADGEEE